MSAAVFQAAAARFDVAAAAARTRWADAHTRAARVQDGHNDDVKARILAAIAAAMREEASRSGVRE